MKHFWQHITFLLIVLLPALSSAQEKDAGKIIEAIIESHIDNIEEGTDVALIVEDLENLVEHPININATNNIELSRLYVLNPIQINKLLDYIINFGPAYSIFELQTIDGFTRELLLKIQPFIFFGEQQKAVNSFKQNLKYAQHQLLLRSIGTVQKAKGYKPKENETIPYEGNRYRYYTRYKFLVGDKLSAGFTAEKDPGEAFFKGSNKHGFDYNSGHISFKLNNTFENISLGDFVVRAGQGLVLWQGYTSGKSADVLGIIKNGQGIRGYTSVDENRYFRGAATTLKMGNIKLSIFYSQKKVDGNSVVTDSTSYFTSLQTSGYHRTQNEIDDEKSVENINTGGIFSWNFKHLRVGATFVYQQFDKPCIRSTQPYNLYRLSGTKNYTTGINYLFSKGKYQLFGEAAVSKSKGKAIVQGAIVHLNDQLGFSVLFRHFDKNYHALWANTFAEGTNISNESGLFFGTKFLPAKHITLSAYSDIYRSNWINFSTASPANNWDIFVQAEFRFSEKLSFYTRFKNEEKEQKFKDNKLYINLPERIQKTRFHLQYKPLQILTLKSRFEHVYYHGQTGENGFLLFQDLQYSPQQIPINLSLRLAYFKTDSYESRIYAYENDILYTFSIPAYYGQGFRTYINIRYQIVENLDCYLKAANTHWTDRKSISSGYNQLEGSNKTELKFQLRLKF